MQIQVSELTLNQLNMLVAKVEGVEVMTYRHNEDEYIAEELEFEPEGHCNAYCLKQFKMWCFYQPTTDWKLAGPILERERINITTYADEEETEAPYFGAMYGDFLHEQTGKTASEAVIRSFIAKVYGDTIDLENLPSFKRVAIVRVTGMTCEDWIDREFSEVYVEEEIEVEVETTNEAEWKGVQYMIGHFDIQSQFQRWK